MIDKKTRVLNVRVPEDLFLEIRARAGRTDRTNGEIVAEALRCLLGRSDSENATPSRTTA
jgi:hypothetical protein